MIATVDAIYENGILKLSHPLPLQDNVQVLVIVQSKDDGSSWNEREAWLRLSEENLTRVWDNTADDIFNELLNR